MYNTHIIIYALLDMHTGGGYIPIVSHSHCWSGILSHIIPFMSPLGQDWMETNAI